MYHIQRIVPVLLVNSMTACGDDDASAGTEGGPCFPNATCNSGLGWPLYEDYVLSIICDACYSDCDGVIGSCP